MARGDHLYYFRAAGMYSHHGIDCGDGTVIHYESSLWRKLAGMVSVAATPTVRRTSWAEFAQGEEVLIRSYDDVTYVESVETALARAERRIGEACYDVVGNNCEHFVVWCKTGVAESSQVDSHRNAADAVVRGAPLGALLLRTAARAPSSYHGMFKLSAIAVAGTVYASSFLHERVRNKDAGRS